MGKETNKNNIVTIIGEIVSNFEFDHELYGEKFYTANLSTLRNSGVADVIPIMVSERLVDVEAYWKGRSVKVDGQFRSYNDRESTTKKLILSVFVCEFEEMDDLPFMDCENRIFLDGHICKETNYRETSLGRQICDILLAVNRPYGKSDYIPCIAWGRNAKYAGNLAVGTHIKLDGRIQSREYRKCIGEDAYATITVYEVSIAKLEVVKDKES